MNGTNKALFIVFIIVAMLVVAPAASKAFAEVDSQVHDDSATMNAPDPIGQIAQQCGASASPFDGSHVADLSADGCDQATGITSNAGSLLPGGVTAITDEPSAGNGAARNGTLDLQADDGNRPASVKPNIPLPEPVAAPADNAAASLFLVPKSDAIRIRSTPVDGQIIDLVNLGEVIQVVEPATIAQNKIGVYDQWVEVRKQDGTTGYTAAWLYAIANAVTPDVANIAAPVPVAPVTPQANNVAALFIRAESDEVRVRTRPVDGQVVEVVNLGEVVQVLEPVSTAQAKIGKSGQWVQILTPEGKEGYTAAWLYAVDNLVVSPVTAVPADTTTSTADPNQTGGLYLQPKWSDIRVRATPIDGQVVDVVSEDQPIEVIEPVEVALPRIGVDGQWVKVRTADGIEGYTAAWLYDVADIRQPDTTTIDPLVSDTPDLGLVPDAANSQPVLTGPIPPLANSIAALNVPTGPSAEEAASQPAEPAPTSGETVVQSPDSPDSGVLPSVADLVNNIVPITVQLMDSTSVKSAELAINGYPLVSFTEEPFAYDLDTSLLASGEYKLTFSVVSNDGMELADDMYFEVAVDEPPLGSLLADTASPQVTDPPASAVTASPDPLAQPASDARRILTIDGQERPFNFEFSAEQGLVPTQIDTTTPNSLVINSPDSLGEVLSAPFIAIVPTPVRDFLTADRPTLAALIIILMVIILIPQGFFTIYWMTYTWNNPEVADEYQSPREFVEPQYSFTALVPARHEESVIKDTIRTVDRIDYPEHLKEILILIRDEDDDATIRAAKEVIEELGRDNIRLITFTDGPRNKPNGLNKGLKEATKDVVCIFDAEDEPHPDIYNIVNTVMVRDEADVVQSGVQLMNFGSSWFSAFTVLEYFFWFKSGLHAFTRKFNVTPLGGNTVFFKRHWMERLNGWDEQCLTEDADIGLRLTQMGAKIQIVYDAEHATREETPDTAENFIKQRTRWCQGFYQIFLKGGWAKLPSMKQKIVALYILLNSLLQASMIFFIPVGLYIALTQRIPVPIAMLSYVPIYILLAQMVTSLVGIREFTKAYGEHLPMFFTLRMIVYYYPYQLMLSVAAFRAVIRMMTRQGSWEKTAHANLHRQSQLSGVA